MIESKKQLTDFEEIERAKTKPTEVPKETEIVDMSIDPKWPKWKQDKKVESESVWENLTPRQMKFIELYVGDMLGNWVQCYLEVYDIDETKVWWYKNACACASRLLSNGKVYNKINTMLEESGLNDNFVDKQMLFLISQQADFVAKTKMIDSYNKLKWRITEKIKSEWASEDAKADVIKKLGEKIDTMKPDEINTALNDLLNN